MLLHSGLLFFGTFYLLFAAHKLEHTHRGANTHTHTEAHALPEGKKCIKKGYNRVGKFEILLQAVVWQLCECLDEDIIILLLLLK